MKRLENLSDLAIFGAEPLFKTIRSTSNLVRPDKKNFYSYVKKSFDQRWITNNGPVVLELEKRLENLHEVKHCVTFCNGFWGIVLTIKQLALPGRKEVIMPAMTYRRLGDIAAWANLTPHFCDVDEASLSATVETVAACISNNTALILIAQPIVHICDMESLSQFSQDVGLPIVFDSVEASYASVDGKIIGAFGNAECFSMHASKLINGFEGGYVTTNDDSLADVLRVNRAFGFIEQDTVQSLGLNAKLNDVHAAMALANIDELPEQISRNIERYKQYCLKLEEVAGIEVVNYDESEKRSYKNILVKLNESWPVSRENTIKIMHAENLLVREYYYPPLHLRKSAYPTIYSDLPSAEKISNEYLLLPSGEFTSMQDIGEICRFMAFIKNNGQQVSESFN